MKLQFAFMTLLFAFVSCPVLAQDVPVQQILFQAIPLDGDASDIYVVDANGANLHNLTDNKFDDSFASWSPDGTQIVFVSNRDYIGEDWYHGYAIYVMDANGANVKRIVDHITYGVNPLWSPDGTLISFIENEDKRKGYNDRDCKVNLIKPDGSNRKTVFGFPMCDDGTTKGAQWSPDGADLLVSNSGSLYVINVENEEARTELVGKPPRYSPKWSKDGTKIAFIKTLTKDNYDIYMVNADGSEEKQLTDGANLEIGPQFALSDSIILFGSGTSNSSGRTNLSLYILTLKDAKLRQLTDNFGEKYAWNVSPDKSEAEVIYTQSTKLGNYIIRLLNIKTLEEHLLVRDAFKYVIGFSWRPVKQDV